MYTESPSASPSNIVRSWTCEVTLPDSTACSVSYQRDGPRCHRFSFREPLRERLWHMELLEGGAYAIEQKAQELAPAAFEQARSREQHEMRRATAPGGYKEQPLSGGMERLRMKTAKQLGGLYAVCVRFESGNLMPVGCAYDHPNWALAEYESGQHSDTLSGSNRYVIGLCCRWQRRWIEPRFLAQRLLGSLVVADRAEPHESAAKNDPGEDALPEKQDAAHEQTDNT